MNRHTAIALLLCLACVALVACGGGNADDDDKGTRPVDCKAQPELCR